MVERKTTVLLDNLIFPEDPRWRGDKLWFSDVFAKEVITVDLLGNRETVTHVPNQPSGLGWSKNGNLLIVSMTDRKLMMFGEDGLTEVADMSSAATFHCNDMVVDKMGRAYVGNFGGPVGDDGSPPIPANMILIDSDYKVSVAASGLHFPNGVVVTPDGKTLIVAETFGDRLTAFDINRDGSLSGRRVWASLDSHPDGICIDVEGHIWVATIGEEGSVLRVKDGGDIVDRIDIDSWTPFACTLGGPDLKTLFILESKTSEPEMMDGRNNGRITMIDVDVPGAGYP